MNNQKKKIKREVDMVKDIDIPNTDKPEIPKIDKVEIKTEEKMEIDEINETKIVETVPKKKDNAELRNLKMSDFKKALSEISASVSENAFAIAELRKWNEIFGEGGNRKKPTLSYFG